MKKKILIALALVAVVTLSIGGTMAFLTAHKEDTNTFTIGEVNINLLSKNDDKTVTLMPNNTEKKEVAYQIENTGKNDAYVWLRLTIPTELEDEKGLAAKNIIHWNTPGAFWNGYHTSEKYLASARDMGYLGDDEVVADEDTWLVTEANNNMKTLVVDGVSYNVYDIMYKGKLTTGETTNVGISTIFMDERVDYVDGKWALVEKGVVTPIDFDFSKGASVNVEAYAIQANGFDTVEEAYAAYQKQWNK